MSSQKKKSVAAANKLAAPVAVPAPAPAPAPVPASEPAPAPGPAPAVPSTPNTAAAAPTPDTVSNPAPTAVAAGAAAKEATPALAAVSAPAHPATAPTSEAFGGAGGGAEQLSPLKKPRGPPLPIYASSPSKLVETTFAEYTVDSTRQQQPYVVARYEGFDRNTVHEFLHVSKFQFLSFFVGGMFTGRRLPCCHFC